MWIVCTLPACALRPRQPERRIRDPRDRSVTYAGGGHFRGGSKFVSSFERGVNFVAGFRGGAQFCREKYFQFFIKIFSKGIQFSFK